MEHKQMKQESIQPWMSTPTAQQMGISWFGSVVNGQTLPCAANAELFLIVFIYLCFREPRNRDCRNCLHYQRQCVLWLEVACLRCLVTATSARDVLVDMLQRPKDQFCVEMGSRRANCCYGDQTLQDCPSLEISGSPEVGIFAGNKTGFALGDQAARYTS